MFAGILSFLISSNSLQSSNWNWSLLHAAAEHIRKKTHSEKLSADFIPAYTRESIAKPFFFYLFRWKKSIDPESFQHNHNPAEILRESHSLFLFHLALVVSFRVFFSRTFARSFACSRRKKKFCMRHKNALAAGFLLAPSKADFTLFWLCRKSEMAFTESPIELTTTSNWVSPLRQTRALSTRLSNLSNDDEDWGKIMCERAASKL